MCDVYMLACVINEQLSHLYGIFHMSEILGSDFAAWSPTNANRRPTRLPRKYWFTNTNCN